MMRRLMEGDIQNKIYQSEGEFCLRIKDLVCYMTGNPDYLDGVNDIAIMGQYLDGVADNMQNGQKVAKAAHWMKKVSK